MFSLTIWEWLQVFPSIFTKELINWSYGWIVCCICRYQRDGLKKVGGFDCEIQLLFVSLLKSRSVRVCNLVNSISLPAWIIWFLWSWWGRGQAWTHNCYYFKVCRFQEVLRFYWVSSEYYPAVFHRIYWSPILPFPQSPILSIFESFRPIKNRFQRSLIF